MNLVPINEVVEEVLKREKKRISSSKTHLRKTGHPLGSGIAGMLDPRLAEPPQSSAGDSRTGLVRYHLRVVTAQAVWTQKDWALSSCSEYQKDWFPGSDSPAPSLTAQDFQTGLSLVASVGLPAVDQRGT